MINLFKVLSTHCSNIFRTRIMFMSIVVEWGLLSSLWNFCFFIFIFIFIFIYSVIPCTFLYFFTKCVLQVNSHFMFLLTPSLFYPLFHSRHSSFSFFFSSPLLFLILYLYFNFFFYFFQFLFFQFILFSSPSPFSFFLSFIFNIFFSFFYRIYFLFPFSYSSFSSSRFPFLFIQ